MNSTMASNFLCNVRLEENMSHLTKVRDCLYIGLKLQRSSVKVPVVEDSTWGICNMKE